MNAVRAFRALDAFLTDQDVVEWGETEFPENLAEALVADMTDLDWHELERALPERSQAWTENMLRSLEFAPAERAVPILFVVLSGSPGSELQGLAEELLEEFL